MRRLVQSSLLQSHLFLWNWGQKKVTNRDCFSATIQIGWLRFVRFEISFPNKICRNLGFILTFNWLLKCYESRWTSSIDYQDRKKSDRVANKANVRRANLAQQWFESNLVRRKTCNHQKSSNTPCSSSTETENMRKHDHCVLAELTINRHIYL